MERREKSFDLVYKYVRRLSQGVILGGTVLGAGFLLQPGESLAQGQRSEPLPTPIVPPNSEVELVLFAGCELGSRRWEGRATHYYPGKGCQGCNAENKTASGEILNFVDRTVAFMRLPFFSRVKITNEENGLVTDAKVNDTGGFEDRGFIIDLSPATKEALQAGDITSVSIDELVHCR